MKTYSFSKAKEIIETNKDNLSLASLGMHEDWAWTAVNIWEDGEYKKELPDNADALYEEYDTKRQNGASLMDEDLRQYDNILIAGIYSSSWATPTLCLVFKDGTEKMIEVSNGKSSKKASPFPILGPLSGPVQENITPITKL